MNFKNFESTIAYNHMKKLLRMFDVARNATTNGKKLKFKNKVKSTKLFLQEVQVDR